MSAQGALLAGRIRAESLMVDTCVVKRPNGRTVQDSNTGSEVPAYTTLFTSKCKVQARSLAALNAEVGGRTATTVRVELHLPTSVPEVRRGDVATISVVGNLSDLSLLGTAFTVVGPVGKSYATARRLEVEEIIA